MNKIHVTYGDNPCAMALRLLREIAPLEGWDKSTVIGIKPNLVSASHPSEGAVTHPEIVEGILIYLLEEGFKDIKILEGSWIGDETERAFDVCGYLPLAEKYGVPLIDLKKDTWTELFYDGYGIKICNEILKVNYLINVPLVKGHCQTKITCALKNLKGIIPDIEKRRFHTVGLHKPIAVLNKLVKQHLIIADGICPDPYFEEGGRPSNMNLVALAFDPVLMDVFAAETLGYQKEDVSYILQASDLGVGSMGPYDIIETHTQWKSMERITQPKEKYLNLVDESGACSACYASLVGALKRIDDERLAEYLVENICIGQDYRGYSGSVGIGDCTNACLKNLSGCPPEQDDIYIFLRNLIKDNR